MDMEQFAAAVSLLKEAGMQFTPDQTVWVLNRLQELADQQKDSPILTTWAELPSREDAK